MPSLDETRAQPENGDNGVSDSEPASPAVPDPDELYDSRLDMVESSGSRQTLILTPIVSHQPRIKCQKGAERGRGMVDTRLGLMRHGRLDVHGWSQCGKNRMEQQKQVMFCTVCHQNKGCRDQHARKWSEEGCESLCKDDVTDHEKLN